MDWFIKQEWFCLFVFNLNGVGWTSRAGVNLGRTFSDSVAQGDKSEWLSLPLEMDEFVNIGFSQFLIIQF